MIVFRHTDPRFPFVWESTTQPAARWHDAGEGPAHHFSETPDGAWAEFTRHEEISDAADNETISRSLWAIDLPQVPRTAPSLSLETLTGGVDTYDACRREARSIRARSLDGLVAPSAAIVGETASGFRTDGGLRPGPARSERTVVVFGPHRTSSGGSPAPRGARGPTWSSVSVGCPDRSRPHDDGCHDRDRWRAARPASVGARAAQERRAGWATSRSTAPEPGGSVA